MIGARCAVMAGLSVSVAACAEPHLATCLIHCGPGDACPSGMTCEQGLCGAPGSSCAGALPRISFSPSSFANVVLWLEADSGIGAADGQPVSLWRDQSPADNSA